MAHLRFSPDSGPYDFLLQKWLDIYNVITIQFSLVYRDVYRGTVKGLLGKLNLELFLLVILMILTIMKQGQRASWSLKFALHPF